MCTIFCTVSGKNKVKGSSAPQTFASADAKHQSSSAEARVAQMTLSAPAARKTRAASRSVAPVVRISSMSRMRAPLDLLLVHGGINAGDVLLPLLARGERGLRGGWSLVFWQKPPRARCPSGGRSRAQGGTTGRSRAPVCAFRHGNKRHKVELPAKMARPRSARECRQSPCSGSGFHGNL